MAEQVKVPAVGESIEEVTLSSWIKQDGEAVAMDEVIAELESDKATFELTAPQAGVLRTLKQAGDTAPVGTVICEIIPEGKAEKKPSNDKPAAVAPPADAPATIKEMRVPEVGESITEVTVAEWLKQDGDRVEQDEVIAELESDKATFELPAEAPGILKIVAKKGDVLPVGELLCTIEESAEGGSSPSNNVPSEAPAVRDRVPDKASYATGHPSPAAKKILDEKGVAPSHVKGSGPDGRITKADAANAASKPPVATPATPSTAAVPSRGERRQKISSLRKTIARRLVAVKNETAMLTTFNEVNMKPIMDLRKAYKEKFKEKYGVGLGFMSFFTKAICEALKEFPAVNAYIDGDEVVYHDYCDISIAVSTPRGLVVPVIRNADTLRMHEIEQEVVRLATRGRDGKLSIEEMTGGTFSITNGGVFGSMLSTPILNPPQSAILGMHNIVSRPVALGQEVAVRPIMYVALSYDHRIIDGRESVSFLVRVKEMLEEPSRLILGI